MICSTFRHSRAVIDALDDLKNEVVMYMPDQLPRIDLTIARGMIVPLAGEMDAFGVNKGTGVRMLMVVLAVIGFEDVVSVPFAADMRTGVMILLAVPVFAVATDFSVTVLVDFDANKWAATTTALESITILASSKETLLFRREAFSCRPAADWNCRALQARMPSCHV